MVILEAAAIGAVGYAGYRGGEEAIRKGKQTQRDLKLQGRIRGHRNDMKDKIRERQERMATLNACRTSTPSASSSSIDSGNNSNSTRSTESGSTCSTTDLRMQGVISRLRDENSSKNKGLFKGLFAKK